MFCVIISFLFDYSLLSVVFAILFPALLFSPSVLPTSRTIPFFSYTFFSVFFLMLSLTTIIQFHLVYFYIQKRFISHKPAHLVTSTNVIPDLTVVRPEVLEPFHALNGPLQNALPSSAM